VVNEGWRERDVALNFTFMLSDSSNTTSQPVLDGQTVDVDGLSGELSSPSGLKHVIERGNLL
jgi:hypothetical protein